MKNFKNSSDRHASSGASNSSDADKLIFSEVLRPRSFDELMLPNEVIEKLKKMVATDEIMNMIFVGRPGSGKTSTSILLSKNREALRKNASSEGDSLSLKKTIASYAGTLALTFQRKIVILDEADRMPAGLQVALRTLIEDAHKNCRFLLIANDIKKIDSALISRCMPLCFDIDDNDIEAMILKYFRIVKERLRELEKSIPDQKLAQIVKLNFPDWRAIANEIGLAVM